MRILSWNIQWGRGVDGKVDLSRVVGVLRQHDADVVCLQEVAAHHPELPGGVIEDQSMLLAAALPGFAATYGVASDLRGSAGERRLFGNLILSRFPVLQVFRHALPWPADPAVPSMPRVALEAVVNGPGGPLRVVTTHLEYYSAKQRLAQVEGLRAMHREAWGHGGALRPDTQVDAPFAAYPRPRQAVYCGDFNFPPEAPEYGLMLAPIDGASSLCDAWTLARPAEPHAPSVGVNGADWPDHPYCCDYFFVSEEAARRVRAVTIDAATQASDHQPALLDLVH